MCEFIYAEGYEAAQEQTKAMEWKPQVRVMDRASGKRALADPHAVNDPAETDRFREGDDDWNSPCMEGVPDRYTRIP